MEEFAIVLANGEVVMNKVNILGKEFYLQQISYNSLGRVERFLCNGYPVTSLYTNENNRPFSRYFNETTFNEFKDKKKGTMDSSKFLNYNLEYTFNLSWFIKANNGATIKTRRNFLKNETTTDPNDDQICYLEFSFSYDITQHDFKTNQDLPLPFPANYQASPSSVCLTNNDQLLALYKQNASRSGIDKKVLLDIVYILEKMRRVDGDFYQFLQNNNLTDIWDNQNILWADQDALNAYYDYTNYDFIKYRNWLEQYYLNFKYYRNQINTLTNNDEKFFIAASFFDTKTLTHLTVDEKIKILKVIAEGCITDWWSGNFKGGSRENLVLRVVKSVPDNQINEFLDKLIVKYEDGELQGQVLYQPLYNKVDGDNQKVFVLKLLEYWTKSKFNPYSPDGTLIQTRMDQYVFGTSAPFTLSYRSSEFLGIYFNNFNFSFDSVAGYINAKEQVTTITEYGVSEEYNQFGKYKLFQPVSLLDTDFESTVKMPVLGVGNSAELNSLVPIFFIKYVDDTNDWESFKAAVGLFVDVALTFSGIGNLAKLRHLRNLTRLGQVAAIIGGIDVALGVIDILLNVATNNCNNQQDEFCKRLQKYLFCLQLASGAGDFAVNYALKKSANKLKEIEASYPNSFTQDCRNLINSHATDIDILSNFIAEAKRNILKRIRDKARNGINAFNEFHFTNQQLNDLIGEGVNLRMTQREIEDFIFIATRKQQGKSILFNDLKVQMANWKNVIEPRGYPYKFLGVNTAEGLENFNVFSQRTKSIMDDFHLPTDNVFIQGSSLRKISADDIDIAVFLSKEELDNFVKIQEDIWRQRKGLAAGATNAEFRKYQNSIQGAIRGGKVDPDWFKNVAGKNIKNVAEEPLGNLNHIFDGVANYTPPKKFNLSIIIKGGPYDVSPYIKLP